MKSKEDIFKEHLESYLRLSFPKGKFPQLVERWIGLMEESPAIYSAMEEYGLQQYQQAKKDSYISFCIPKTQSDENTTGMVS